MLREWVLAMISQSNLTLGRKLGVSRYEMKLEGLPDWLCCWVELEGWLEVDDECGRLWWSIFEEDDDESSSSGRLLTLPMIEIDEIAEKTLERRCKLE